MSNEKNNIAKSIFMKYCGSHFHMEREGNYKYYKSFDVSEEQESLWIDECQNELLNEIKSEDVVSFNFIKLVGIISQYKRIDGLCALLEFVKMKNGKLDTFSQIRIAEEIMGVVKAFDANAMNIDVIREAQKLASDIVNNIDIDNVSIAIYYKDLGYLTDILTEENIINRIKNFRRRWDKYTS
ncbi:hypothetical protein [Anaerosinus massiliensis]|uniref:hypothetical protein n=1 Tax=Massilibacillus massiliensis TaxID=1806837 RepID=UPI000DA6182D|nr:hypothetical protein [Massilibacillus massiliensis]